MIWWLIGCRISYRADELGGKSLQNASRVEKEIREGEEEKGGWGKYDKRTRRGKIENAVQ